MIFIVLVWAYLIFTFYNWGILFLSLFFKKNSEPQKEFLPQNHFTMLVLLGLVFVTSFLGFSSLALPISLTVHVIVFAISVLSLLSHFKTIKKAFVQYFVYLKNLHWSIYILFIFILPFILMESFDNRFYVYDEGLYYLQNTRWTQAFSVVPGLGNLHGRLAFNSHWHLLSAFTDPSFLNLGYFNDLNGLLFLLVFMYALSGFNNVLKGVTNTQNVLKMALIIVLIIIPFFITKFQIINLINSPTADFAFLCFGAITFIELSGTLTLFKKTVLIILTTFCLVLKVSSIPVLIVPAIFIFYQFTTNKHKLSFILLALLIVMPWFARNIYLSGYLVYPLKIDLFSFDWEISSAQVNAEAQAIKNWAKIPREPDVVHMSVKEWFPVWFKNQSNVHKLLFFNSILSLIVLFVLIYYYKLSKKVLIYALFIVGFAFCYFQAPDLRFGYGFSISLFIANLFFIFHYWLQKHKKSFIIAFSVLLLSIYTLNVYQEFYHRYHYKFFLKSLFSYPTDYIDKTQVKAYPINNINFYYPIKNNQCWDSPLPCTTHLDILKKNLVLRGKKISDGFRHKNKTK